MEKCRRIEEEEGARGGGRIGKVRVRRGKARRSCDTLLCSERVEK